MPYGENLVYHKNWVALSRFCPLAAESSEENPGNGFSLNENTRLTWSKGVAVLPSHDLYQINQISPNSHPPLKHQSWGYPDQTQPENEQPRQSHSHLLSGEWRIL